MKKKIAIIGVLTAGIGTAVVWKSAPWSAQEDDGTVFASRRPGLLSVSSLRFQKRMV